MKFKNFRTTAANAVALSSQAVVASVMLAWPLVCFQTDAAAQEHGAEHAAETGHGAAGHHEAAGADAHAAGHDAHGAAHHASLGDLLWPVVNFTAYAAIAVYLYRKSGKPALRNRKITIEQHLQRAAASLADAERALALSTQRAEDIAREQEQVVAELEAEGKRVAELLLQKADQSARSIRDDSRRLIGQELEKATATIRKQVVASASRMAREQLTGKISGEDDARLRREALDALFGN